MKKNEERMEELAKILTANAASFDVAIAVLRIASIIGGDTELTDADGECVAEQIVSMAIYEQIGSN